MVGKMKKHIVYCMAFLLFGTTCFARDFIVQFVDENYKETQSSFSYLPVIYHSIQVTSQAGPKLLILKGEDYHYRNWVRQYIATGKAFVVKIPDDRVDLFITSSAFEMDVTDIHPMNLAKYRQGEKEYKKDPDREDFYKNSYGSSSKKSSDSQNKQDKEMEHSKKAQKDRAKKERTDQNTAKKQELKNKQLEKQAQKKQKERSKQLAARELKKKQDQAKELAKALEKEKQDKAKRLAQLAAQNAVEEENRRQELALRWLELKKRLLEDESIKSLDQAAREQELNRRWFELKQKFDIR